MKNQLAKEWKGYAGGTVSLTKANLNGVIIIQNKALQMGFV